jgi:hypothetical protein
MSLVVIAYPKLSTADFKWLQATRQQKDKFYYKVVRPHFTFVFPTNKLDADTLSQHVKNKIKNFNNIPFELTTAKGLKDDFSDFYHVFLLPSIGNDQISQLHDRLYSGDLRSELRLDLPYISHLGIGSSEDKSEMDNLAEELNRKNLSIKGKIEELTIAEYDGKKVSDLIKFPLN